MTKRDIQAGDWVRFTLPSTVPGRRNRNRGPFIGEVVLIEQVDGKERILVAGGGYVTRARIKEVRRA